MNFFHVDVFSSKPMSGNGLTVVFPEQPLSDKRLLEITQELRQFETIFIYKRNESGAFPVRIFTMEEELTFAGHPILGAGAVIHNLFFSSQNMVQILFDLSGRILNIESSFSDGLYDVTMNQGLPKFIKKIEKNYYKEIAEALSIRECDIEGDLPVEVVSTGLPYLLVPVKNNLLSTKISIKWFENFLTNFGAKFVYVFEPKTLDCRTWDNSGATEDVATGSAAGPLCAYLVKNGLKKNGEIININQGKFINRPSIIQGWILRQEVFIRGNVSFFASGNIDI